MAFCGCPNFMTLPVQFDIHSPATTVREALAYSAELRLADVQSTQLQGFINEVDHASFFSFQVKALPQEF